MISQLNPVAIKIRELVKTEQTTLEKICVVADLKYNTLTNIFTRTSVSQMVLKALQHCGIISDKDVIEYRRWFLENGVKGEK